MSSQWARLLKNQGVWVGSFSQISAAGEMLAETPTEVILQPLNSGNTIRQVVRKYPSGQPVKETELEYRSLGKGVLFCDTGAFSQGSLQWSPVSDFGAELGLIHQTERLRVALTFFRQPALTQLTLIREHLQDTEPTPRPHLTVDQLLGTWVGEAVTVFPDWQPEQTMTTRLTIEAITADQIRQTLQFGQSGAAIQTQGRRQGAVLNFKQGRQPVTVLLLPEGASASFPTSIQPSQPLFLELGWLISPTWRQRLIRTYDQRGTLANLTLVTEQKLE